MDRAELGYNSTFRTENGALQLQLKEKWYTVIEELFQSRGIFWRSTKVFHVLDPEGKKEYIMKDLWQS
jgi:hypothetical protein